MLPIIAIGIFVIIALFSLGLLVQFLPFLGGVMIGLLLVGGAILLAKFMPSQLTFFKTEKLSFNLSSLLAVFGIALIVISFLGSTVLGFFNSFFGVIVPVGGNFLGLPITSTPTIEGLLNIVLTIAITTIVSYFLTGYLKMKRRKRR